MSAEAHEVRARAPRITAEDVFQAADALLVAGHRPTIDRIRMKLGRGSPNTINEHLDKWWANLGARLKDLPGQVLPGLPEVVTNSLVSLWNLALRESHQTLLANLETRESTLQAGLAHIDARDSELNERESAVTARLEAQGQALEFAHSQLAEANRRARTLEEALGQRAHDFEAVRARMVTLEADAADLRRQLLESQQQHASERRRLEERYDAQQRRWSQEVDRLRQSLKDDQRATKELRTRLERAVAERDAARSALGRTTAELKAANRTLQRLEAHPPSAKAASRPRRAAQKPAPRPRARKS